MRNELGTRDSLLWNDRPVPRRHVLRLAALAGASVLVGACSSAAQSLAPTLVPSAKPSSSSAGAAPSFAPATVNSLNSASVIAQAIPGMASVEGYYSQFSITPKYQILKSQTDAVRALTSGAADIAIGLGITALFTAVEHGGDLKLLAGEMVKPNYVICANNASGIKTITDVSGKSVGTGGPGSLTDTMVRQVLKNHSITSSSVTFVTIGSSAEVYQAVAAKKVDFGVADVALSPRMAADGVHVVVDLWKELPDFVTLGIYASGSAISQKREALVRLLAAWGEAFRYIRSSGSESPYVAEFVKLGGKSSDGQFDWNWMHQAQPLAYALTLSSQQINYMQKLNVEAGSQKAVLPVAKVADMSLAQDALKLMTVS